MCIRDRITGYLVENAADTGGQRYGGKLMRGVSLANPPLSITELPMRVREHNGISTRTWKRKDCLLYTSLLVDDVA